MASEFKISQSGVTIKRGIKFHFGGDFNYSVIIDCQLDGTWKNGFFTWSGAGPGLTGQAEVFNGESSFVLRGTYENVNDATQTGSFNFSPVSGTIPTNGFVDVQVSPGVILPKNNILPKSFGDEDTNCNSHTLYFENNVNADITVKINYVDCNDDRKHTSVEYVVRKGTKNIGSFTTTKDWWCNCTPESDGKYTYFNN